MKLSPRLGLLLLAPLGLVACMHVSPGNRSAKTTTERAAGAFTRIDVRGPIDVIIHEGRPAAMSVTAEGIATDKIETRIDGDTLVVDLDSDAIHWCVGICAHDETARLDLDVPVLNGVKIDGSGDVTVLGAGAHAKLDLDVNGSGDVHYSGNAELVACSVEGSGDVTLNGAGKRLKLSVTGSGDVNARAFAVEGGEFVIEGSGDVLADLHGGDTTVRMHGSGDLHYTGEARITSLDIDGSGEVSHQ